MDTMCGRYEEVTDKARSDLTGRKRVDVGYENKQLSAALRQIFHAVEGRSGKVVYVLAASRLIGWAQVRPTKGRTPASRKVTE
jgi:hypothetical protein